MIKKCSFCGNKNLRQKDVQYIFRREGKMLLVNDVPCIECEFCGERYFAGEILKKIELDFAEIYHNGKKTTKTIKVPVESFVGIRKKP
ncbi:MAG: type II toxin-antitoxin system MqsA family antitoxin [Candidatus Wallbacteria bacterium]|nr:type II toxin-antitoxin system MqsA family antitoxin [Candidatus Wallbacteria bacterium]